MNAELGRSGKTEPTTEAAVPSILPAAWPFAAAVLSIVRSGLPITPAVLPKVVSVLPIGLAVRFCAMSVVFDRVTVDPFGQEVSIGVRAAALYDVAIDSETADVDACRPSAGPCVPGAHACDVDNRSVAADNWFGAPSIQIETMDNLVETTDNLVGVAAAVPGR